MAEKPGSLQDQFLNTCRKERQQVTVYLNNGVKLQGLISGFDNFCILVRRGPQTQLVYKHGVASIVPMGALPAHGEGENGEPVETIDESDLPVITGEGSFQIA